jgi:ribonucleoside-diphosphate reductase beta chain
MQPEPILTETLDRFHLFPIKYTTAYDMYKKQVASFWSTDEVDLGHDIHDWDNLSEGDRKFVLHVLSFFNASDLIVNENLAQNFSVEVQVPEIRMFYGFQIGMETIHTEMYALLIETYEKDALKRQTLQNAIVHDESIKLKADWALKWISDKNATFAQRLIAFACVEGIFFSASFCAIFYFKKKGKLPGLTFSNELISRDEALHRDFAVHVYSLLSNKLPESDVHELIDSAVQAENNYVKSGLEVDLIGMKAEMMQEYVRYVADHLLTSLGYTKKYNVTNPFDWMDLISMEGKTNFFEKRVGEYAKANSMNYNDPTSKSFALDAEF